MFHPSLFPVSCLRCHMRPASLRIVLPGILTILTIVFSTGAEADPRPVDGDFTFACVYLGDCPPRTVPGGPDRDVRPFEGTLGRPCAWRERPTPSGPRRVRTCS